MQQPQDEAHHHRHDKSRRQRNEEREIIALDTNVSRQVSEAELCEQGPGEADGDEDDAERDEQTGHGYDAIATIDWTEAYWRKSA